MSVGVPPRTDEMVDQDKVGITKKTYGFSEYSEDFQFNVPFKSENDQDFFEKLFHNVKKYGFVLVENQCFLLVFKGNISVYIVLYFFDVYFLCRNYTKNAWIWCRK